MNDSDVDELGPVDYVVVEFPADKANFSGEMARSCPHWSSATSCAYLICCL